MLTNDFASAYTDLTATDLFCGAGGSGLGLEGAGVRLVIAANHWKLAIETHALNFAHAEHDCADISQVDPRRYPATDLLWASPECTNHSQAKGVSRKRQRDANPIIVNGEELPPLPIEAAERSRATMWDVPRFAEAMALRGKPYRGIIVENVVDAHEWVLFRAWLQAMHDLGYDHKVVCLNSAFASDYTNIMPAPQSRDRMYVVFWRKGDRAPNLDFRPHAFCTPCDTFVEAIQTWKRPDRTRGRYRQQYIYTCPRCTNPIEPEYLPAASAIDWTLPGQRIGDRDKRLADGTMRRIQAGLDKYCGEDLHLEVGANTFERAGSGYYRVWPTSQLFTTQTATASKALAMIVPVDRNKAWSTKVARSVAELMPTQTARATLGITLPPFITLLRGGGSHGEGGVYGVDEPLNCVTASGNHHGLCMPGFVMRNNGSHGRPGVEHCTPFTEPVRTITTKGHQSVVTSPRTPAIDDCHFRMLQPHEIGAAMAFRHDYDVLGNKRERVRQYGNAVTPPAAQLIVSALASAITGEETIAA